MRRLVIAALIITNPFVAGWFAGFYDNAKWQAQGALVAQERTYKVICPAYRDAGFVGRWVRPSMWENSWCKDYVARL